VKKESEKQNRGFTPIVDFDDVSTSLKRSSRTSSKFTTGFTLIELLVVVAIIGILSTIVISSLNSARERGKIASIKSNLKNMIAQAELAYDVPGNYSTVCADAGIVKMLSAITSVGGTASCYTYDNTRWAVSVKLNSDNTKNYSVDQSGVVEWETTYNPDTAMTWGNANTFCSGRGGRLPSLEQLRALWVAHGSINPIPTSTGFRADGYWSNTTVPTNTADAYVFYMTSGGVITNDKTLGNYVRCVR